MNGPGMPPCTLYLHAFITPAWVLGINWGVAARVPGGVGVLVECVCMCVLFSRHLGEPVHPGTNKARLTRWELIQLSF